MLILEGANDLLQVVSASAASLEVHASFVDSSNADPPVIKGSSAWRTNTAAITGAGSTTTVVAAPGASTKRAVKHLNIFNDHASASTLTAVQHTDGTNVETLWEGTLLAQESVVLDAAGRWTQYDANGLPKPAAYPVATQADMEAGASLVTFVTPGRQHFHPSAAKGWVKAGTSANVLAGYNITSLTDTGTGDVAVTIATDFSGADYATPMAVQRINSTAAEANCRVGTIKTASMAAGSFSMDCWDTTATTNVVKDPTSWHAACFGDQA